MQLILSALLALSRISTPLANTLKDRIIKCDGACQTYLCRHLPRQQITAVVTLPPTKDNTNNTSDPQRTSTLRVVRFYVGASFPTLSSLPTLSPPTRVFTRVYTLLYSLVLRLSTSFISI